ncbi:amidohydrolase family protein [Sphingomonas sp.]|uniref:amidohydrolase family protein n=1 Tax=Sphingomonas sp. TaxID=28214 RepID=UPI002DD67C7D|nr:amidohydrolase family protein [Sphingomonas sp.]
MRWLGGGLGAIALLAAAAILIPPSAAPLPDADRSYLIQRVRIVDVETGAIGAPTSVTVRDGRIAAIGAADAAGLRVVDGGGGWLIPGLWDMHVHTFQLSPQMHLPLFVANGVTSVRDMMDCPGVRDSLIACVADKRRWTAAAAEGQMASPRFVAVASYYLDKPSLTPADVRAQIAAAAGRGIDAVKVYNRLTPTAYRAAAEAARAHRLRLVGHLPQAVSLEAAIAAGQSSFEHGHLLVRHCFREGAAWRAGRLAGADPTSLAEAMVRDHEPAACGRAFDAMRTAGVALVPTHVTREEDARATDPAFVDDARLAHLDPLSRWAYRDDLNGTATHYPGPRGAAALRAYFDHGLRLTGAARRAGVRVLVGTDTGVGGLRYHDEMAHLVRAGLTPAEVLRAATIDAARHQGLDRESGSITVGKRADLVLLAGDPIANIANSRSIRAVFLAGRLYDRDGLDALTDFNRGQAGNPANWVRLLWGFARSSVAADL